MLVLTNSSVRYRKTCSFSQLLRIFLLLHRCKALNLIIKLHLCQMSAEELGSWNFKFSTILFLNQSTTQVPTSKLSPLLQCREAIPGAALVCLRRPTDPFSSDVLGDAGVERGARLLGGRACVAVDLGLLACSSHRRSFVRRLGLGFFFVLSAAMAFGGGVSGEA